MLLAGLDRQPHVSLSSPPPITLGFADSRLYAPVAFLFWAAVRFGMPGATAATAILTCFAVAATLSAEGPHSEQARMRSCVRPAAVPVVARGAPVSRGGVARSGEAHPAFAERQRAALSRHGRQRASHDLARGRRRAANSPTRAGSNSGAARCPRNVATAGRRACIPMTSNAASRATSRVSRRAANSNWITAYGDVTASTAGSWLAACRATTTRASSSASSARRIDVTERRQQESALRQSEERYRAVVDSQTELVCRFTPDTDADIRQRGVLPLSRQAA